MMQEPDIYMDNKNKQPLMLSGMEEIQGKDSDDKIKSDEEQRQLDTEVIKESFLVLKDVEEKEGDKQSDADGDRIQISVNTKLINGPYSCPTCGKMFKRKVNLRAHLSAHTTMKVYECSKCEKKFHQEHLLSYHMASHTSGRHKCFICGKRYRYKRSLIVHQRTHEREKQVGCSGNRKEFVKVSGLVHHVTVYMNWPFKCIYCSRGFDNQEECNRHMATHAGEAPYECVLCSAKFSCKKDLQCHGFTHYVENVLKCEKCCKVFKTKHSFDCHIKCHNFKQTSCEICGKSFNREDRMKSHMITHGAMRPFYCPKCKKICKHKNSVKVHLISHSGDEVCPCHVCGNEFNEERQISDLISHSGKISHDSPQFLHLLRKGKNNLDSELNGKDEKEHMCHICGKSYLEKQSLIDHMTVHLQCMKCKMTFKTKEALDAHLLFLGSEKLLACCLCGNILHGKRELHRHLSEHIKAKQDYFDNPSKSEERNKKVLKITTKLRQDSNETLPLISPVNQGASVKIHVVTHAGKNSLKCSECGRKVHLRHNLEDHLKSNKKDKSLQLPESGEEFVYISRFGHPMLNRKELPESYCNCNHNIGRLLNSDTEDSPKTDLIPCQGFAGCIGNKYGSECVAQTVPCPQKIDFLPKTPIKHDTEMLCKIDEKTNLEWEIIPVHRIDGIKSEVPDSDIVIKEEWDVPW